MTDHYWSKFWVEHGAQSDAAHPQAQVFRTLHKEPIEEEAWQSTLRHISKALDAGPEDHVLDLCGGNGLIAEALAGECNSVVVVDISDGLLAHADERAASIECIRGDMREVEFEANRFDRILCYAALQYLTPPEAAALFSRAFRWLAPGGRLFVGDVPDAALQWEFYNSDERRKAYFSKLEAGEPIVGTWFDRQWLSHLATSVGFSTAEAMDQPKDQIYSWFRFDILCQK